MDEKDRSMLHSRTRATKTWPNVLLGVAIVLSGCEGNDASSDGASPRNSVPSPVVTAGEPEVEREFVATLDPAAPSSSRGAELYLANCAICHGARGQGGVGPPLADNPNIRVTDYVVAQVLLGGGGMPPFAPRLSDSEIAAVVSFVGVSFGDGAGTVSAEEVGLRRSGLRPGMRLGQAGEAADQADGPDDPSAGGLSAGERVYVRQGCSACHGVEGGGGIGPALAGNARLAEDSYVIGQILSGGGGMPPFADRLSDEEVAAVANHERTSWGNDFGTISADEVAGRRPASEERP
jgi:mono/diheme cytochrome c family protein